MSSSFSKTILVGSVGTEPIIKNTNNGSLMSYFLLPVESYSKGNGKKAEWFNIICFGKQAEIVEKYIRKGTLVAVDGVVSLNSYTSQKDNQTRHQLQIVASNITFMTSPKNQFSSNNEQTPEENSDQTPTTSFDDECPF